LVVEEWDRDDPQAMRHIKALLRQFRPDGANFLPPLSDDRLICNTLSDAAIPTVRIAPIEQPSRCATAKGGGAGQYPLGQRPTAACGNAG